MTERNHNIVIAFDSETMRALYRKALEEEQYTVTECTDGLEALHLMFTVHPEVVLIYIDCPVINAFDFTRIIKNTPYLMDINVVICSSDFKTSYMFWNEKTLSNGLFVANGHNMDELKEMVKGLLPDYFMQTSIRPDPNTTDLVSCLTNALDNGLFNLYVADSAFSQIRNISDIHSIVLNIIKSLKTIYTYDALGIIVNDEPLIEFYDTKSSLSDQEVKDFKEICHKDFEGIAKNRKNCIWQKSLVLNTRFDASVEKGKLKTYEVFPVEHKSPYAMTIHISTCRQDSLSLELRSKLDYFAEVYSKLIANAISYHKVITTNLRIRHAFGRFVPQQYIDSIVSGNGNTDIAVGESRKVAVLISDIRNFTNISEVNKPENVVNFLNKYFSVMSSIIKENGGNIDKFMGDAIMALFGATESYEDNANRAAKTAYEMMKVLPGLDLSMIKIPEGFSFNIGIGINYGEVIVGSIGSDEKQDFTVIGDNVNLASRLESLNKMYGSHIIITESVKEDLREPYPTRLLDRVKVKGKSIPVSIYQLLTDKEDYPEDFIENYNKGMDLYLMGIWQRAGEYFSKAMEIYPEDKAAELLHDRCLNYTKNRPDSWDGSFTLTTK